MGKCVEGSGRKKKVWLQEDGRKGRLTRYEGQRQNRSPDENRVRWMVVRDALRERKGRRVRERGGGGGGERERRKEKERDGWRELGTSYQCFLSASRCTTQRNRPCRSGPVSRRRARRASTEICRTLRWEQRWRALKRRLGTWSSLLRWYLRHKVVVGEKSEEKTETDPINVLLYLFS